MSTNDGLTADVYESNKNKRAVEEALEAATLGDRGVRAAVRGRNRVLFAAIPGVAGAGGGSGADPAAAQMLSRRANGINTTVINEYTTDDSVAQQLERRGGGLSGRDR